MLLFLSSFIQFSNDTTSIYRPDFHTYVSSFFCDTTIFFNSQGLTAKKIFLVPIYSKGPYNMKTLGYYSRKDSYLYEWVAKAQALAGAGAGTVLNKGIGPQEYSKECSQQQAVLLQKQQEQKLKKMESWDGDGGDEVSDILFFGSCNGRRKAFLELLKTRAQVQNGGVNKGGGGGWYILADITVYLTRYLCQ